MSARLRGIARETVRIVDRGGYTAADGTVVDIGADVRRAVAGTRLHLPGEALSAEPTVPVAPVVPVGGGTRVEVTGESTLAAARRLGGEPACLVFASARNPGGGFLNGAQAQEESVARSSALYACLLAAEPFYVHHRGDRDLRYSDRVIHAPGVPVFRDDRGALLAEPFRVSFLTAAAPNAAALRRSQPERVGSVPAVLARRAARVLEVASAHGHRDVVLGAWGCGVFGNSPRAVAEAFASALGGFAFRTATFAILDRTGTTRTAFESALAAHL